MHASTPHILRKSRMRRRACTDPCGGRSASVVPTATVMMGCGANGHALPEVTSRRSGYMRATEMPCVYRLVFRTALAGAGTDSAMRRCVQLSIDIAQSAGMLRVAHREEMRGTNSEGLLQALINEGGAIDPFGSRLCYSLPAQGTSYCSAGLRQAPMDLWSNCSPKSGTDTVDLSGQRAQVA